MKSLFEYINEAVDPNRFPIKGSIQDMLMFLQSHGFEVMNFPNDDRPFDDKNIPEFHKAKTKAVFITKNEKTMVFFDNSRRKLDERNPMYCVWDLSNGISFDITSIYVDKSYGDAFETTWSKKASPKTFAQKVQDAFGF